MKHLFSIALLFAFVTVNGQEKSGTYELKLNGKTIIKKRAIPDGEAPMVKLTAKQLKTGAKLQFKITDADNFPQWKRKLMLNDVGENEIRTMEKNGVSGTYDWNITDLKLLLEKYKTLKIFTYCTPIDENQGAMIRIRRFHLCTLALN
jgi:hypothetical protein